MARRRALGFEVENLPDGVIVQRELRSRHFLRTLRGLRECFLNGAATVDDNARPRSRICHAVSPNRREIRSEKECSANNNARGFFHAPFAANQAAALRPELPSRTIPPLIFPNNAVCEATASPAQTSLPWSLGASDPLGPDSGGGVPNPPLPR